MKIPEINILSSGTWNNLKGKVKTPARFVLTYEIEYHHIGYGETTINGHTYPIQKDSVTFNRPGDLRHSVLRSEDTHTETDFFYFVLSGDDNSAGFDHLIRNIPNHTVADERITELWTKTWDCFAKRKDPICEMQAYCNLLLLLTHLSQRSHAEEMPSSLPHQSALFEAIRFMQEHLTENLSVEDMAAHIGYSQSHFHHLFKSYTQHTPYSYYVSLKISEAKYMLLNTDRTLTEISAALGFGKVSQFCNAFTKDCHVPPGQFRKSRDTALYNG